MRIAITGGTGFIGEALVPVLIADGHDLVVLTRDPAAARAQLPAGVAVAPYTPLARGGWESALDGADAVVHLAGAPITGRWTGTTKRAMRDSRWTGTRVLVEAMLDRPVPPAALVSMSAARAYGTGDATVFDETSPRPAAPDLLALICKGWEEAALAAQAAGVRTVIPRAGVVLDLGEGIKRALPYLRPFAGGRVGSGRQWFSWIHRTDMVQIIRTALTDDSMTGLYNATAPEPVPMDQFTSLLGDILGSRARVPVPGFVIERFLGDGATIVLHGQRVAPARLLEHGFDFRYPTLDGALRAMF
jgi:uncharacterized protein (TIGR01777 family)